MCRGCLELLISRVVFGFIPTGAVPGNSHPEMQSQSKPQAPAHRWRSLCFAGTSKKKKKVLASTCAVFDVHNTVAAPCSLCSCDLWQPWWDQWGQHSQNACFKETPGILL